MSNRTYKNDLILRAARGEKTPRPPVWLMRQAGRTDPQYNALKQRLDRPLEELFRDPSAAVPISLLPRRLGVDAIIYFQDILTPLTPMGVNFVFRPGPVTDTPVRSQVDVDRLTLYDVEAALPFIRETFEGIHAELDGAMPVLGFAGAPLTLLVFMLEGKSFGNEAPAAMEFLRSQPVPARKLLDKLTEMTIAYLLYQIRSGAAAVQLFESAAHLLTPALYSEYALPYQQRILEALNGSVPTIMFAREWEHVEDIALSGADIVSLPSILTIAEARKRIGEDCVIQGNLDNHLLAYGSPQQIEMATRACIESGQCRGHIFNLSHGLLRDTPYENIERMMKIVLEWDSTR